MPLFYSEKTFCFYYNPPYEEETLLHPRTDVTDRLMNVTLFYDASFDCYRGYEMGTLNIARAGPLQLFQGGLISREILSSMELHSREVVGLCHCNERIGSIQ